jgi:hypothetical protein
MMNLPPLFDLGDFGLESCSFVGHYRDEKRQGNTDTKVPLRRFVIGGGRRHMFWRATYVPCDIS